MIESSVKIDPFTTFIIIIWSNLNIHYNLNQIALEDEAFRIIRKRKQVPSNSKPIFSIICFFGINIVCLS